MAYFMKKERVIEILDDRVSAKYIFPNTANGQITLNALTKVSNSIVGGSSPLLIGHVSPDRFSETRFVNVSRGVEFKESFIDVPIEISDKIDEYNELLQSDNLSEEEVKQMKSLKKELISYFDRD